MNKSEMIIDFIDSHRDELIQFARRLISIPSVNPPGDERKIAQAVADEVIKQKLGAARHHAKKEERPNLVLEIQGGRPGKTLLWNGHLDTKPVGDLDKWLTNPFEPIIQDGKLYGLGAADMKSGVAAFVFAAAAVKEVIKEWTGSLLLVFTADEEAGGSYGAEYLCKEIGLKADIGLIGEPVGIQKNWETLDLISRGETCFRIQVRGTQMHSSIADLVPSVNASVKMAQVMATFSQRMTYTYEPHPLCPQGVTMGVGVMLNGGVYYGVYPGFAEFCTDVRLLPGMTPQNVRRDVEKFLEQLRREDPELEVHLEFEPPPLGDISPVVVSEDEPFVTHLKNATESVLGRCPPFGAFPGWTDARFFDSLLGIKTIPAFGPGLLTVTHAPNEYVHVESIIEACKIYALAACDYFHHH